MTGLATSESPERLGASRGLTDSNGSTAATAPGHSLGLRQIALLAALLGAHALLAWEVRGRAIFTFGDDAAYLLLGRSLRAFSYREMQFAGNPIAARFPPAYPAVLAVLGSVFGERLDVIAIAGILLSASGLVALFDVIRRRWSTDLAFLVTATVAVNPVLVANAGIPATETMFVSLTLWALWAADRSDVAVSRSARTTRISVLAGAFSIAAALTRSAGVTLPLALGMHWLQRRRYRRVVTLAIASALTVGAWLAWTVLAPKREMRRSYVDDAVNVRVGDGSFASTLAHRVATNTSTYIGQAILTELHLPVSRRTRLDNVAWVALLGLLLVAGVWSAWRRWNASVWYVATYSLLLAVWAFALERFLDPLVPLVIALVLIGAWMIARRVRVMGPLPVVTGVVLMACALEGDVRLTERAEACGRSRADCAEPESLNYVDAAAYIAKHTPAGARIVAPKGPTLYYFAKRQALYWDEVIAQAPRSFGDFLDENAVSYILTTPVYSDHITLLRLAQHECTRLELVHAFSPQTLLLAVHAEGGMGDSGRACRAVARARSRAEAAPGGAGG